MTWPLANQALLQNPLLRLTQRCPILLQGSYPAVKRVATVAPPRLKLEGQSRVKARQHGLQAGVKPTSEYQHKLSHLLVSALLY